MKISSSLPLFQRNKQTHGVDYNDETVSGNSALLQREKREGACALFVRKNSDMFTNLPSAWKSLRENFQDSNSQVLLDFFHVFCTLFFVPEQVEEEDCFTTRRCQNSRSWPCPNTGSVLATGSATVVRLQWISIIDNEWMPVAVNWKKFLTRADRGTARRRDGEKLPAPLALRTGTDHSLS